MSWFDPRAITGLLAVALCFAFALVLFRAGDRGGVARKLALLLVVEGVTLASSISVASLFLDPASPNAFSLRKLIHTVGDCSLLAMYPSFLAVALQTPLTRPFATRGAQRALAVGAAALGAASMWWAATRCTLTP